MDSKIRFSLAAGIASTGALMSTPAQAIRACLGYDIFDVVIDNTMVRIEIATVVCMMLGLGLGSLMKTSLNIMATLFSVLIGCVAAVGVGGYMLRLAAPCEGQSGGGWVTRSIISVVVIAFITYPLARHSMKTMMVDRLRGVAFLAGIAILAACCTFAEVQGHHDGRRSWSH